MRKLIRKSLRFFYCWEKTDKIPREAKIGFTF